MKKFPTLCSLFLCFTFSPICLDFNSPILSFLVVIFNTQQHHIHVYRYIFIFSFTRGFSSFLKFNCYLNVMKELFLLLTVQCVLYTISFYESFRERKNLFNYAKRLIVDRRMIEQCSTLCNFY